MRRLGAQVTEIPFIEIRRPRSFLPLDRALRRISDYDWLVLTSVNGVQALFLRLRKVGVSRPQLQHLKIAVIGPATKAAIESHGLRVEVLPTEYVAESVVEKLRGKVKGKRILLARALRTFGDVVGARTELERARVTFARMEARTLVDEIDRSLADLAEGPPAAAPAAAD